MTCSIGASSTTRGTRRAIAAARSSPERRGARGDHSPCSRDTPHMEPAPVYNAVNSAAGGRNLRTGSTAGAPNQHGLLFDNRVYFLPEHLNLASRKCARGPVAYAQDLVLRTGGPGKPRPTTPGPSAPTDVGKEPSTSTAIPSRHTGTGRAGRFQSGRSRGSATTPDWCCPNWGVTDTRSALGASRRAHGSGRRSRINANDGRRLPHWWATRCARDVMARRRTPGVGERT